MFSTDLEDNYVAGVHAAAYYIDYIEGKDSNYYNSIALKNMDYYISMIHKIYLETIHLIQRKMIHMADGN